MNGECINKEVVIKFCLNFVNAVWVAFGVNNKYKLV